MAEAGQAEQAIAVAQAISEGIWSLLERAMANFAAAGLDALVRIVKR